MKALAWFAGLSVVVGVCFASACGESSSSGGDTQTNWLKTCANDDDCGGLECICGRCTKSCTVPVDCDTTPVETSCNDPTSPAALAFCGNVAPPSGICLANCGADVECASDQRCVGGVCLPQDGANSDGGTGDAGLAADVVDFCERWVEARCNYVETCGCGGDTAAQCRVDFAPSCLPGGFFESVAAAVAAGNLVYHAEAATALLARFDDPESLCVEPTYRSMRLTSDELYSWAGVFTGTHALGSSCTLPVGYKGGFNDCAEGFCAGLETGGGVCIAFVGLGEECDASGDHNLVGTTPRLCFDERPSDLDGEYESAFDSLSCVPSAPGSTTLICARDLEDGQPCNDDEACASGRCQQTGVQMGICAPKLAVGEFCESGSDCSSDSCPFTGSTATICEALRADGGACSYDQECVSGSCHDTGTGTLVCGPRLDLAIGEACTADHECLTRVCRMGTCWAEICGDYLAP